VRLVVCAAATALGACAGNFAASEDLPGLKRAVVAEMGMVIPHVRPEHLKRCQQMLEQPSALGVAYKINGRLAPSIPHSCMAQGRGSIAAFETQRRVVVFAAHVVQVAGFGMRWDSQMGVCAFGMNVGNPEITVSFGPQKAAAGHVCHRI
jgi:hypothetical protein